jgi:serine/threonine-protein kinase RsbW
MTSNEQLVLSLPAHKKYLGLVGSMIQEICETIPCMPKSASYNIELAVNEAIVNVITHAYGDSGKGKLEITFEILREAFRIQIRDWGLGFDVSAIRDPDLSVPHESGYGVYLIRQLMDEASYQPGTQNGNLVTLVKNTRG